MSRAGTGAPGDREREVKLAVHDRYELPDLTGVVPGAVVATLPPRRLRATYWDTPDLRLVRAGVTVRFREEGNGTSLWTVKLPSAKSSGHLLVRQELEFDGASSAVPEVAQRLLSAYTRRAPLGPVVDLASDRDRFELRDWRGNPIAEIDDDRVSAFEAGRVTTRFREIEVELAAEQAGSLAEEVVGALREAGASEAEPLPKVVRALGSRARSPGDLEVDRPGKDSSASELVRACLADGVARLVAHDPGVRLGDDPEEIHQARVATRRMRSDLVSLGPLVVRPWAERLRSELRWIADPLGRARDADVLLQRLWASCSSLPAADIEAAAGPLEHAARQRDQARLAARQMLDTARYLSLLDSLIEAVQSPALGPSAGVAAKVAAPAIVGDPWRRLRKRVGGVGPSPRPEDLHAVRIAAKRCRYAAETAAIVIGRPALRLARAMREVQDVLGDLQDALVAETWLRGLPGQARLSPAQSLILGELVGEQRRLGDLALSRWPAAWERASAKKLRKWMR